MLKYKNVVFQVLVEISKNQFMVNFKYVEIVPHRGQMLNNQIGKKITCSFGTTILTVQ